MADLILGAVIALMILGAAGYVFRAKRRGVKCIGCPAGERCSSHPEGAHYTCTCGGSCGCHGCDSSD